MDAMLVLARIFLTAHLALMRMFLSYFLNITILDYYTVKGKGKELPSFKRQLFSCTLVFHRFFY